jgi:mono/diheme cytochrome c family protein
MKTGFHVRAQEKAVAGVAAALLTIAIAAIRWSPVQDVFSRWSHGRVDFSRDIRPIFNQNCVACHGGVRQKNGVSFFATKLWAKANPAVRRSCLGIPIRLS